MVSSQLKENTKHARRAQPCYHSNLRSCCISQPAPLGHDSTICSRPHLEAAYRASTSCLPTNQNENTGVRQSAALMTNKCAYCVETASSHSSNQFMLRVQVQREKHPLCWGSYLTWGFVRQHQQLGNGKRTGSDGQNHIVVKNMENHCTKMNTAPANCPGLSAAASTYTAKHRPSKPKAKGHGPIMP